MFPNRHHYRHHYRRKEFLSFSCCTARECQISLAEAHSLPRLLQPLAAELARSLHSATFVLDHCGNPRVASGDFEYWRKQIRSLATLPNVYCKISGVIGYDDPARWREGEIAVVAEDLRPYIEQVIDSFGWQRVVWGSDFPVCKLTKGLTTWKHVTDLLMRGASDHELDALAQDNARRIYRLN